MIRKEIYGQKTISVQEGREDAQKALEIERGTNVDERDLMTISNNKVQRLEKELETSKRVTHELCSGPEDWKEKFQALERI